MLLSFPETPTFGRCYPRPCSAKLQLRPNDKLHAVRRPVTAMASRSDQPKLPVDKCYKVFVERQDTQIEQIIRWVNQ